VKTPKRENAENDLSQISQKRLRTRIIATKFTIGKMIYSIEARRYWRCKSRNLGGRPQISADLRALIRRMSVENVLWGAPRIHGELLKLGFAVAQSTVAKYMAKNCDRWVKKLNR
jgi:hypothetical protein